MKRIDIQFRQRKQFARFPLSQDEYEIILSRSLFDFPPNVFYVIRISVSENRNVRVMFAQLVREYSVFRVFRKIINL